MTDSVISKKEISRPSVARLTLFNDLIFNHLIGRTRTPNGGPWVPLLSYKTFYTENFQLLFMLFLNLTSKVLTISSWIKSSCTVGIRERKLKVNFPLPRGVKTRDGWWEVCFNSVFLLKDGQFLNIDFVPIFSFLTVLVSESRLRDFVRVLQLRSLNLYTKFI
jgi:hypothetical protein